jgi:hypothetical protein
VRNQLHVSGRDALIVHVAIAIRAIPVVHFIISPCSGKRRRVLVERVGACSRTVSGASRRLIPCGQNSRLTAKIFGNLAFE